MDLDSQSRYTRWGGEASNFINPATILQIPRGQSGLSDDRSESAHWERAVTVDWYNHEKISAVLSQVMMTTPDVGERKSASLQGPNNGPAGHPWQTGHATWMSILTNSATEVPEGIDIPSFEAASM